jgi:hypothetical protein
LPPAKAVPTNWFHSLKTELLQGINFTNNLCTHFLCESKLSNFSLIMFCFVIFGTKILCKKCFRKMLMKLSEGVSMARLSVSVVKNFVGGTLQYGEEVKKEGNFIY